MNLLARREHSQFELRRKLKAKGYAKNLIDNVLRDLIKENLQSDQRFAENYIAMRTRRGFGPFRITVELRERGINDDIIDQFTKKNDEYWNTEAMRVREKKFGTEAPISLIECIKQEKFLQYRGFSTEQIKSALEN
jgi:regulatory protein